jgi:hypothetical protein
MPPYPLEISHGFQFAYTCVKVGSLLATRNAPALHLCNLSLSHLGFQSVAASHVWSYFKTVDTLHEDLNFGVVWRLQYLKSRDQTLKGEVLSSDRRRGGWSPQNTGVNYHLWHPVGRLSCATGRVPSFITHYTAESTPAAQETRHNIRTSPAHCSVHKDEQLVRIHSNNN